MQLITDKIEQLLIKFAKYVLSKERNNMISNDKSEIYDADLANFRDNNNLDKDYNINDITVIQKADNTNMTTDYDGI